MTTTALQRLFAPFKKYLPGLVWKPIHNLATAILTPILFSYRTGHFRSSLKMAAVDSHGTALPWYTYPCIDFLRARSFDGKNILEFGGGQSTFWWAAGRTRVVTLEGSREWHAKLAPLIPPNVDLFYVTDLCAQECIADVERILSDLALKFDVIIIDGLHRYEMIDIACRYVAGNGAIICDDSEGYGFQSGFQDRGMNRVDFFGYAPGSVLPHCTSVFFSTSSFLLEPHWQIPAMAIRA